MSVGVQSSYEPLRRVLVCQPQDLYNPSRLQQWKALGFREAVDPQLAQQQHSQFVSELKSRGIQVDFLPILTSEECVNDFGQDVSIDALYAHDACFMTPAGMILLAPGKPNRRIEKEIVRGWCKSANVPVVGEITGKGRLEGGDVLWLARDLVCVGMSYRTNEEGVQQLGSLLASQGVSLMKVDLPHFRGPEELLHLQTALSILDKDLAIACLPVMPVTLSRWFTENGVKVIPVSEQELVDLEATNVLAIAPRVVLAMKECPRVVEEMRRHGCDVIEFESTEICNKGNGGPTCLTRPIWRSS
eukprot:ANDGO_02149.mRNA.1 Uncharacterized protein YkgA